MSRHDLSGSVTRLTKIVQDLNVHAAETAPQWQDQQAQRYFHQHIEQIEPTVKRLISGLNETLEIAHDLAKKLADPQHYH